MENQDQLNKRQELVSSEMPKFEGVASRSLEELLDATLDFVKKYLVLTQAQYTAVTLWVAHTWVYKAFDTTPYLSIRSPEKQSGKSRLLEVIELLCHAPTMTANISVSALAHMVSKGCTLLIDEVDTIFGRNSGDHEELRGILNQGFRRNGTFIRMVGQSTVQEPVAISVFGAKALGGIGGLPDTLEDRSVIISMRRKTKEEHVAKFFYRIAEPEAKPIRDDWEKWASPTIDVLKNQTTQVPEQLSDRAQEGWESLMAIAELSGDKWWKLAWESALELHSVNVREETSVGVKLLIDIRNIFEVIKLSRITTAELITNLKDIETSDWSDWNRGGGITPQQLAKHLKPYEISPKQNRVAEDNKRGYEFDSFKDAFSRYIPSLPQKDDTSDTDVTTGMNNGHKPDDTNLIQNETVTPVTDVGASQGVREEVDILGFGKVE